LEGATGTITVLLHQSADVIVRTQVTLQAAEDPSQASLEGSGFCCHQSSPLLQAADTLRLDSQDTLTWSDQGRYGFCTKPFSLFISRSPSFFFFFLVVVVVLGF
jgi:hypothetical protein